MIDIPTLATKLGIPVEDINLAHYRTQVFSIDTMLGAMATVNEIMESNTLMMGGLTTVPQLMGYRQIRKASNDIDCAATEEGIVLLHDALKGNYQMFISRQFGDLVLDYEGIPFSFVTDLSRLWKIPEDLWISAVSIDSDFGKIRVISPEYLITLKTRRAYYQGRVYGKDKLDIANVLLAGQLKEGFSPVNTVKIARLMNTHISIHLEEVQKYLNEMSNVKSALRADEIPIVAKEYERLQNSLKEFYTK